jgi:threonine dehydratase
MHRMRLEHAYLARQRIAPFVRRTALVHSPWLSALTGLSVRLKLESLQVTNSFKARGAVNVAAAHLERGVGDRGRDGLLVTASAGNHGRAMAYAAERLGLRLVVFTPSNAPRSKLDHILRHGADLRAVASSYEEAESLAKDFAARERVTYVSPYSHPDVIAGAATVALEILEDWPSVEAIVVPVGGGGLISGVAAAAKAMSACVEVLGVEAESSPAFSSSLAAGRIVMVDVKPTIADGLAGNMDPASITFECVRGSVDRVVVAPEGAIEEAVRRLVSDDHLIAEGAGAVGVAGLLTGLRPKGMKIAVVVSGSNIDTDRLVGILRPRP